MDATQDQTDVLSFAALEPVADGFRNFITAGNENIAEHLLIDRAQLLTLTAPELTALYGGLRVLGVGVSSSSAFTGSVGILDNAFFINLLQMNTVWKPASWGDGYFYIGVDRNTGTKTHVATRVDLVFGSNSVLRALCEVYACDDGKEQFVRDFCQAFGKVMNLDRFDITPQSKL